MGRTLCGRSWTLADRRSSVLQQGAATVKSEPERMNCIMPLASARDSIEPCCPQFTRMCRFCPSWKIITGKEAWRSCRYCGRPAAPAGAPALPAPRWTHATAARERSAPRDSSSNPDTAQDHRISQPTHHTRHAEDQSTYLNAYVQPCATIIPSDSHQQ
jgi:hypothetical protein